MPVEANEDIYNFESLYFDSKIPLVKPRKAFYECGKNLGYKKHMKFKHIVRNQKEAKKQRILFNMEPRAKEIKRRMYGDKGKSEK